MMAFINFLYGLAIIAALATVFTTLGTLNGRLVGGFTIANTPWAVSAGVFAAAVVVAVLVKIFHTATRRPPEPL